MIREGYEINCDCDFCKGVEGVGLMAHIYHEQPTDLKEIGEIDWDELWDRALEIERLKAKHPPITHYLPTDCFK